MDPDQLASKKPADLDLHILKQDISSIRMVILVVKQFNKFILSMSDQETWFSLLSIKR